MGRGDNFAYRVLNTSCVVGSNGGREAVRMLDTDKILIIRSTGNNSKGCVVPTTNLVIDPVVLFQKRNGAQTGISKINLIIPEKMFERSGEELELGSRKAGGGRVSRRLD